MSHPQTVVVMYEVVMVDNAVPSDDGDWSHGSYGGGDSGGSCSTYHVVQLYRALKPI